MIFAAILGGCYKLLGDSDITIKMLLDNADSVFLIVFLIFYRLKMHFDDTEYFKHFDEDLSKYKYLGLLAAVLIWFLLAFSGFLVRYPETSCQILALSFILSTIWIALHLIEISKERNQSIALKFVQNLRHKWIIVNMLYISLLELYAQESDVMLTVRGSMPVHLDLTKWGFILLMIVVMGIDHAISLKKPPQNKGPSAA